MPEKLTDAELVAMREWAATMDKWWPGSKILSHIDAQTAEIARLRKREAVWREWYQSQRDALLASGDKASRAAEQRIDWSYAAVEKLMAEDGRGTGGE